MIMSRFILPLALLLAIAPAAQAQSIVSGEQQFLTTQTSNQARPVTRLGVEDGLSQGSVQAMIQDEQGFLWFGTQAGLNKYDGYTFTVYESEPDDSTTLGDNDVSGIVQDQRGNLWISGSGGNLSRLDISTDTITRYQNDPANGNSLTADGINDIHVSEDGTVWVATSGGLSRYNVETDNFRQYLAGNAGPDSLSFPRVAVINEDQSGSLWLLVDDFEDDRAVSVYDRLDPVANTITTFADLPSDNVSPARNVFSWTWRGRIQPFLADSRPTPRDT